MKKSLNPLCIKNIVENAKHPSLPIGSTFRQACVFLLLFEKDEPCVLAILKSDNEGYPWRNQIALPGGHVDDNDVSHMDTAFRELAEEMNINRETVIFTGSIGHFQTINNRDIEVFTGVWDNKKPVQYDSSEIAKVLEIPLQDLLRIHTKNKFHEYMPSFGELTYPVEGAVIWGVTAKILHHFIDLLFPYFQDS